MKMNFRRNRKTNRWAFAAIGVGVVAGGATAQADTASFQEGDTNGYAGTDDTWFSNRANGESNGFPEGSFVRTGVWGTAPAHTDGANQQGLIRFNGIFGGSGIPLGASISSASLTLHVPSDITYADGEQNSVHQMLVDWDETDAYGASPWSGGASQGIDLDDSEAATVAADSSPASLIAQDTTYTLDVTSILQNWSNGASNYGFMFQSSGDLGGNGLFIASSEYAGADGIGARPLLTVDYVPEPTSLVLLGLGSVLIASCRRFRSSI